jgi:uncharacterized protein YybS (DUF2232 family)
VLQTGQADTFKDLAIGIGVTGILFAVTLQSPILGFFCTVCIPLPTLYFRAKLGRKFGAVVPAAALLALVPFLGGVQLDLLYFFELVFVGYMLGELFDWQLPVEKTVGFTCLAGVIAGLVVLAAYGIVTATGVKSLVAAYIRSNLEATVRIYESMGMSVDNLRMIKDSLDSIQYVLVRIVPALFVASVLFVSWTSLLLSRPLLQRRRLPYPDFGRLNLWKAPEALVWATIGCGLMLLIPANALRLLGLNGLLVLMTVYFFQGIAIVAYYFEKKRFPRLLRFFLYSLIALQQVVLLVVVALGFFDLWLNFRRLGVEKKT